MKISINILIALWIGVIALLITQCYVLFKKEDKVNSKLNFKTSNEVAIYHESDNIIAYSKDTQLYLQENINYNVLHYYVFDEKGMVISILRDTIWDK